MDDTADLPRPAGRFPNSGRIEYHRNAPPPQDVEPRDISIHFLRGDRVHRIGGLNQLTARDTFLESGGTYLRLGRWVRVIVEQEEGGQ